MTLWEKAKASQCKQSQLNELLCDSVEYIAEHVDNHTTMIWGILGYLVVLTVWMVINL